MWEKSTLVLEKVCTLINMKLFVFWIVVIVLVVRSPYFHYMFTMYWLSAKGHPLNDFLPHSIVATLKFSKNNRTTETVACCF